MKISKFLRYTLFATMALSFVACENDDDDDDTPPAVNEEEVITDVIFTFTDVDTQVASIFSFSDPDGEGGNAPTIDDIMLNDSSVYSMSIQVQDASNPSDIEDITAEIQEEDDEHQFFFILENGAGTSVSITYNPTDVDDDGNPIGLLSSWVTTAATSGNETVRLVLRHELDKDAAGVSDGDISNAGGSTDVDITFNLTVAQ